MHATDRLKEISGKILSQTRMDLYLSMRYLGEALDALPWQMDLSTVSIGTDMEFMRYNPTFLMQTYLREPKWMARTYLHIILHCLLLHPSAEIPEFKTPAAPVPQTVSAPQTGKIEAAETDPANSAREPDRILWNLACDIAVESIIDSLADCPAVSRTLPDFRAEWYARLEEEMKVPTAEKIYRYLMQNPPDPVAEEKLVAEFTLCDHGFWEEMENREDEGKKGGKDGSREEQNPDGLSKEALEKIWQEKSRRMMAEIENSGSRFGQMTGTLTRILAVSSRKRMRYRDFLGRYAALKEEARVDLDSFDYGFYNYGMELYGNMPLIEENEYRESKKVEELVIVIDTSASCQARLVQHFLNETAAILRSRETFFHRIELRILECDNQVQKDILIRTPEEMKQYLEAFEVSGGFGTDFRPAFEYVERLRSEGHLQNLRGLLYYTDGAGVYPARPTEYETAFVFWSDENYFDRHVPKWCVRVYLGEDDRVTYA